jgi:hypothetical protein
MTIQDSGAGFDPLEAMRGRGLGLTSMKERLKVIGGQLSIDSQRGHGTTVRLSHRSIRRSLADDLEAAARRMCAIAAFAHWRSDNLPCTRLSTARHTPRCLPVKAASGQPGASNGEVAIGLDAGHRHRDARSRLCLPRPRVI